VRAVIEACNSQPFSHIHRPGVAVGGHCIPVYPMMYLSGDPSATVVRAAREANLAMPAYTVDRVEAHVGDLAGRSVCVLGVAYRGGVKETAFSGAFALRDELVGRGASVFAHDPMFSDDELVGLGFAPLGSDTVVDATVVQADHVEYRALDDSMRGRLGLLIDGRDMGIDADVVLGAG
jgi:UDP-N-acetyl-D-mannosaminuronate dehydrogenase